MKVTIKKEDDKKLEFSLKESTVSFANMIRRIAIGQIPVFAIQKVVFYENRSTLFDEYIANRIGLIPLTTPANYKGSDEVMFSLEATGPCIVYSKDIKNYDDKIKVANPGIPIIKLAENQNLRLEAKAVLGIERQHSRHQAGLVAYSQSQDGTFEFKVESFSQMSPKDMMARAAKIAEAKCDELLELVSAAGKKEKE